MRALCCLAVLLAGCENLETFSGTIAVSAGVAPDASAHVLLLINDDYRYPMETVEGMWGTKEGGVYVVEAAPASDLEGEVVYTPGDLAYTYWHAEFAYYPSEVWLGAFLDLDDNGTFDDGEPWGPSAANPISDLPRSSSADDPVIVDITIDRLP